MIGGLFLELLRLLVSKGLGPVVMLMLFRALGCQ